MPNTLSSGRKKKGKRRRLLAWLAILLLLGGGTAFTLAYQHQLSQKAILADSLFASGQYTDALQLYQELATTINPFANRADYRYQQALCHIRQGEWAEAVSLLHADPNHTPSLRLLRQVNTLLSGIVSAGETHSVAVCSNGTAYAAGDNSMGQCQVDAWQNLVAVAAGSHHTLGLTQNGSVLYAGTADAPYGQVEEWRHAVSIAAGETHSVAALSNGRVVAVGDNSFGQCDTKGWSGVIAVAAGKNHTVALRLDGTVIADGDNPSGGCNVEGWQDVISIAAGDGFTLGIDKHGSLLVAGAFDAPEVSDLTAVFAGKKHGIVRTKEGTLLAGGDNSQHQGEVGRWENLFTAAGGGGHSLAITPEGTGVAIGQNTHGQCNVTNWTGIGVPPSALHLCGIASEY